MLPQKNQSPTPPPMSLRPVVAFASTFTCSHWFLMTPLAQVISTRSEPDEPPPGTQSTAVGVGAAAQVPGELVSPTVNAKWLAMLASEIAV